MDPNDILKNPEQLKTLISLLQGLVNQITPEKDIEEETKNKRVAPSKPSSTIKTRGGQKVGNSRSIKSKKIQIENTNEFEKMAEFRMHKDDCVIDKKLCSNPPVARMRDFDFIDVFYQNHHWPVFNLADSAICVGGFLLLIDMVRKHRIA